MSAPPVRPLRAGDDIVYLFDRETVTADVLEGIRNPTLTGMAHAWLRDYAHRFFLTVARNYQPVAGTELHTFASHDDSVLFLDREALVGELPRLAAATVGCFWVMLTEEDVRRTVTAALT